MNAKLTLFGSICILLLLVTSLLTLRAVSQLSEPVPAATQVGGFSHGLETTWPSRKGSNRLWSASAGSGSYRPWIDEHLAALAAAQEALPPLDGGR